MGGPRPTYLKCWTFLGEPCGSVGPRFIARSTQPRRTATITGRSSGLRESLVTSSCTRSKRRRRPRRAEACTGSTSRPAPRRSPGRAPPATSRWNSGGRCPPTIGTARSPWDGNMKSDKTPISGNDLELPAILEFFFRWQKSMKKSHRKIIDFGVV